MSKELLNDTTFRSRVKAFYLEHRAKILDILLFGSAMRGKDAAADIDLLVLFKDKKDLDVGYGLRKALSGYPVQVTSKRYDELLHDSFKAREAVLAEGHSIVHGRSLADGFGYVGMVMFRYSLQGFSKSDRMRFYYSLYGRTSKGFLREVGAVKFSDTLVFCPTASADRLQEFFDSWKIETLSFPVLVPERVQAMLRG